MTTQGFDELPAELKAAIKKEAVQQVSKWIIATIVVLGAAALFGWWLFLKPIIIGELGGVPKGAVAAFDLSDGCPDGWKQFDDASGRFVIGAGQGKGLTERLIRAAGGSEEHKLIVDELPQQQIALQTPVYSASGDRFNAGGKNYLVVGITSNNISIGGAAKEIPMLPPFLALNFCKKV
ncbi:MAG: hypothetical protein E5X53_33610 [Mesorhizobium sp.]|uniref:hypothetical protein n=1 Tax=Mesorhizobium sp. TaxID=1871066 RepID=UPI0011FA2E14|nr:hypothetical protein [Mesorhizobium sp.]TIP69628.1 MAG: hypothetical protein E5X55_31410 [Mesorhizobium sp.]TIR47536.1 MAG: hypothetical protein E5X53_33610 [Mesorhizobium sp.]TJV91759.1 MAG: hypothetical protein E5X52_34285 [Mesorhizobium sp.]